MAKRRYFCTPGYDTKRDADATAAIYRRMGPGYKATVKSDGRGGYKICLRLGKKHRGADRWYRV